MLIKQFTLVKIPGMTHLIYVMILIVSFTEQATDASLDSENWALNMEICDLINESSDNAKDAMKAIRKRLTQYIGKNYTVIL